MRRLIGLALRLYPRPWRQEHGEELEQLTEDLLDDADEQPGRIALSTLVGAARERARPKYLTRGQLVTTGVAAVVLVAAGVGLANLVDHVGVLPFPTSARAPGRLATLTGMESLLRARHVSVTVDGTTIPLLDLAARTVGFEDSASTRGTVVLRPGHAPVQVFQFSPTAALKRAVAYQVLLDLAARQARRDGRVVTVSAARAYAEKEYAIWRLHPVPLRGSVQPKFLTASAIADYRQVLTTDQELTAIAGTSAEDFGNRTPELRRWMGQQLRHVTLVINAMPGLSPNNVVGSLPSGL